MAKNPTSKYLPQEASDQIDELFRRIAVQDRQIEKLDRRLKAQGGSPLQRLDITTYPVPHEGQRAIDPADEQHTWYSNGAWRKCSTSWCRVGFEGEYDFAGGSYPTWDWGSATFTSFITNDAAAFVEDTDTVLVGPGVFGASLRVRCNIDGQFLDLPPQAGTTRLYPGHLLTEIFLQVQGFTDLERTHEWTKEAYDLSANLGTPGLGYFTEQLGGIIGTTDADTAVYPQLISGDALIGPNNTGSFPVLAPTFDGSFWLERISSTFP